MIKYIDWNTLWKEDMIEIISMQQQNDLIKFWNKKAKSFQQNKTRHKQRAEQTITQIGCNKEDTLLDVGAGTGALAIPLAKKVKYLTAVEPSIEMLNTLKAYAKEEEVHNIKTMNKKWEELVVNKDIEKHDIVLASYSLMMLNIKDALIKMNDLARKSVYIFTFPDTNHDELRGKLYGEDQKSMPSYMYLLNILHQEGIYANVNIGEQKHCQRYASYDEALTKITDQYRVESKESQEIVKEYLQERLKKEDNLWTLKHTTKCCMIWWHK